MCGINSASKNAAIIVRGDRAVGVLQWDGMHPITTPRLKVSDDDVLARALYLAKHGHREDGEDLLDLYCSGAVVSLQ